MSEQNRYRIARDYKKETGEWRGWIEDVWRETANTWQETSRKRLHEDSPPGSYQVLSETPSEDGQSGIIQTQYTPPDFWVAAKVKATLIDKLY